MIGECNWLSKKTIVYLGQHNTNRGEETPATYKQISSVKKDKKKRKKTEDIINPGDLNAVVVNVVEMARDAMIFTAVYNAKLKTRTNLLRNVSYARTFIYLHM